MPLISTGLGYPIPLILPVLGPLTNTCQTLPVPFGTTVNHKKVFHLLLVQRRMKSGGEYHTFCLVKSRWSDYPTIKYGPKRL
jgi:hypothetical protein